MDWKDTLQGLLESGAVTSATASAETTSIAEDNHTAGVTRETHHASATPKTKLTIFYEKRRGKPSTIICGFKDSCEESRALASTLKHKLACGGSERDGEILLQGDVRDRVRPILIQMGYIK